MACKRSWVRAPYPPFVISSIRIVIYDTWRRSSVRQKLSSNRGRLPRNESDDPGPSVGELCLAFLRHAETHYVKAGKQTSEVHILRSVVRPLNEFRIAHGPVEMATVCCS